MPLHGLIDTVFRRGCGTSLQAALASDEYERLRQEAHALGLVEPDDSALVQLLGSSLAERAFENVPSSIKDQLHTWSDGVGAQMKLLQLIVDTLRSAHWAESETRAYAYNSDARCVLPAETGSWSDGPVKPNCLGVAGMMAGIAQFMQATHFFANVLRANQDDLHSVKINSLRTIADALHLRPRTEELATKVEGAYAAALEKANAHHQAHHVLVIQTDDGGWWVVDPYLDALYRLAPSPTRDKTLELMSQQRNKMLTTNNPVPGISARTAMLNTRLVALQFMCDIVEAHYQSAAPQMDSILDELRFMASHVWLRKKPMGEPGVFQRELVFMRAQILINNNREHKDLAQFALIYATHEIEDFEELSARVRESPHDTKAHLDACLTRAKEDPTYEEQLAIRLVRFALKNLMTHLDDLHNHADVRHHACLEIGWAPMALGIATLNHMQFEETGGMPATLRGELAMLLRSQWAIYDALVIAQQTGEPIDPKRMTEFTTHLARFDDMPELVIVPLLLLERK